MTSRANLKRQRAEARKREAKEAGHAFCRKCGRKRDTVQEGETATLGPCKFGCKV